METIEDAGKAITCLLEKGSQTVIITMGEKGSVYATTDRRQPVHIPAHKVTPVDSTVRARVSY